MIAGVVDQEALERWGERVGREAEPPLVIVLRGDLGAGKTTLARAIARGAGVQGPVPSPTYNLLFRYPAERHRELVHIDLYRIETDEEIWELGWADLPGYREIVLIEWPERAEAHLPETRWEVEMEEMDAHTRRVSVRAVGGAPMPPGLP